MSARVHSVSSGPPAAVLDALANTRRRRTVTTLRDAPASTLEFEQLVETVCLRGESVDDVRLALRHVHTPVLADAGLVDWSRERHTVTLEHRENRSWSIPSLISILSEIDEMGAADPVATSRLERDGATGEFVDDATASEPPVRAPDVAFSALSHPRRRRLVSVFTRRRGPLSLCELGTELSRSEQTVDGDDTVHTELATTLRHAHLPVLVDAGFLEYHGERDAPVPTVALAPELELDDSWFRSLLSVVGIDVEALERALANRRLESNSSSSSSSTSL